MNCSMTRPARCAHKAAWRLVTWSHDCRAVVDRRYEGMQRRHDLRAFADRRRNALDRTGAYVADREDALAAGFQVAAIAARLGTRQYEPLGVQRHSGPGQPIRIRLGSDEQEEVAD